MTKGTSPHQKNKQSVLEVCKSYDLKIQWIEFCIEQKISYPYMDAIWKYCHADNSCTITEESPKNDTMLRCLKEFDWADDSLKSLVIVGPPGCGKTNWAKIRAKKPALFVTHLDRLKELDVAFHKSIIFDDMEFTHMPRTSQIHLVDRENPRDIHVRYSVAFIPAGIQKIFTANQYPFSEDPAIQRRIRLFNVINQFI